MDKATTTKPPIRKRREQKRAVETKLKILEASLNEFAEKGFDGASIHNIARTIEMTQPLIVYHFGNKEDLWKAVAQHNFEIVSELWDTELTTHSPRADKAIDRLALLIRASLDFMVEHGQFYQFMMRENQADSDRIEWLHVNVLLPLLNRVIPEITEAQADGDFPKGDPMLIHYALIGCASVASSLRAEIKLASDKNITDPEEVERYWSILKDIFFKQARI